MATSFEIILCLDNLLSLVTPFIAIESIQFQSAYTVVLGLIGFAVCQSMDSQVDSKKKDSLLKSAE